MPEGIVLSADSRLTGSKNYGSYIERFTISDSSQKVLLIANSTVGIAFCGDAIIDNQTISDFIRVFDIEKVEDDDTVEEIANKLKSHLQEGYEQYNVDFFVAGYDNDEGFIYTVNKDFVFRKNVNSDGEIIHGATWNGQILPVSKLFQETEFNFELMPLKDAIDFSEFIAEIAIKYERFADILPTCGGPIDILVITKDYSEFYRHKILQP